MKIPRAILSCVIIYYRLLRSGGMRLLTSCSKKKRIVLSPLAQWLPLFRKNNPPVPRAAPPRAPGPLPPVAVVPQRVAPFPVPRREIFPEKTAPCACGSGESSYLCTRFPEGGLARRRPRRSGKKSSGLREKSLAVPEETLTFAARFPLERGSPGRDGSSGPGGEKSDL